MFLKLEDEEHFVYELSKLNPVNFLIKLDSIRNEKYHSLNALEEKYTPTDFLSM